jgi:hypothetical protein
VDDQGVAVDFAIVKGPGLRNGVFLQPVAAGSACDTLNIRAQLTAVQTPADVAVLPRQSACRNNLKLAGVAQDASAQAQFAWPINPGYANPQLSASELAAITPFSIYTFDVYQHGNTTSPAYSYQVRLRTPPPAPDTMRQYAWQDVSKAARDLLTPGTATTFTGGATFPMSWTSASGLPFVKKTNVQIRSTVGGPQVFVSGTARANPAAPKTTVNLAVPGDLGASFPSIAGATGASDMSFANLNWSDTFDLNFSTSVEYDH